MSIDDKVLEINEGSKKGLNGKTVGIIIGVGVVIIIAVLAIFLLNQPKQSDTYEEAEGIYKAQKINYSKEEYESDKAAIDQGQAATSNAAVRMQEINDAVISDLSDRYSPIITPTPDDPTPSPSPTPTPTAEDWCKQLLAKVSDMDAYIKDPYGLSSYDFTSKSGETVIDCRDAAYADVHNAEKYMMNGTTADFQYYAATWKQMAYGLRYSAYYKKMFDYEWMLQAEKNDFQVMSNWFKAGHPTFTKIYTVSLKEEQGNVDKNHSYQMVGEIVTDNGKYTVYSNLIKDSQNQQSFEFYDIKAS